MHSSIGLRVPQVPGLSNYRAELWAERIVGVFRPDLLSNPGEFPVQEFYEFHLVEKYHLRTGTTELPIGVEGITYPDGRIRIAPHVYDQICDSEDGRPRFTLIHESVHGIVHLETLRRLGFALVEPDSSAPALYRRHELPAYADPEWQANRIAAAVLMPSQSVLRITDQYGLDPEAIMGVFHVSHQAAERRLTDLRKLGWLS